MITATAAIFLTIAVLAGGAVMFFAIKAVSDWDAARIRKQSAAKAAAVYKA